MSLSQKIWIGRVGRISSSGNAIVSGQTIRRPGKRQSQLDRHEVNLGPLPQGIVGETVQFAYHGGTYGLCLDIRYIDKEYVEEMAWHIQFKSAGIDLVDLLTENDLPNIVESGDILLAEKLLSSTTNGPHISSSNNQHLIQICSVTDEDWACVGVIDGPVVQNMFPVPVVVTEVTATYLEVRGALPELEDKLPNIGETVTATTGPQHDIGNLALYEGDDPVPVLLEDVEYPSEESLNIEIVSIKDTHLTGKAAFSAGDIDIVHLDTDEISKEDQRSQNRVIKQGVPIDIKPVSADTDTANGIVVTGEGPNALTGRYNIQEKIGSVDIIKGDEIEVDIHSVGSNSCIGYYEKFPIRVKFDTAVPEEFKNETISVSISEVYPDEAIAKPKWITETQEVLEVRIVGTDSDDAIAIREGHPVRIPNSSVIASGDQILVGLLESEESSVTNATVSALPTFQNPESQYLIRLPRVLGDVMIVEGIPVAVGHLSDVDTPLTLGIAEINEDHVVPTVTALPETHLPQREEYILTASKKVADDVIIGVGEELPIKIPHFSPAKDDVITTHVLEHHSEALFGVFTSGNIDADNQLWQVYEYVQLAGYALQQTEYRAAAEHFGEASQSCPSDFPILEWSLATDEKMVRAIPAIRNHTGLSRTADTLSEQSDNIDELKQGEEFTTKVSTFISARQAEVKAVERLLTALNQVNNNGTSNLQAIAQGVSARPSIAKAVEHITIAEELETDAPSKKQNLSLDIQLVIKDFKRVFPGIVDELEPFNYLENDVDWSQYIFRDEVYDWVDAISSDYTSNVDIWERPEVPETMGVFTVTNVQDDGTIITQGTSLNKVVSEQVDGSNTEGRGSLDMHTSQSSQPGFDSSQGTTTEKVSSTTESKRPATGETQESSTVKSELNPQSNEIKTEEQRSVEDISNSDNKATSETGVTPSTSKSEALEPTIPDEQLSQPGNSPMLRKLRKKAEKEASESPERKHVETSTNRYQRSSAIREYALRRANGNCELCGEAAPFQKESGEPFLEVHHVEELGEGGSDHPSLVAAVCPNCHREIHHGRYGEGLNEQLQERLESGLGDVGIID